MTRSVAAAPAPQRPGARAGARAPGCPGSAGRAGRLAAERGEPAYRARQVADAVFGGTVASIDDDRARCPPRCGASWRRPSASTRSPRPSVRVTDGGLTEKALHRLADGALVESVLMHYPARRGAARAAHAVHLEPGRLRRRLPVLRHRRARLRARPRRPPRSSTRSAHASRRLIADGRRLTNIVFMGMGEPLLNLDRVLAADRGAQRPRAGSASARATSRSRPPGVVPGHPPAHRARAAVHAGGLAPRRPRPAARRPRAAQPALAGRGGRRRRARPRAARPAGGSATR